MAKTVVSGSGSQFSLKGAVDASLRNLLATPEAIGVLSRLGKVWVRLAKHGSLYKELDSHA